MAVRRASLSFALLLFAFAQAAFADVWIAGKLAVYKLDPAGNQVAQWIPFLNASAIAVDPGDASIWILSDKGLSKKSVNGARLFDADLRTLGLDGAATLALDAHDGSIWVGPGNGHGNNGRFVHLDRTGRQIATLTVANDDDAQIAIALDQSVWILAAKHLQHYSANGTLLADIALSRFTNGEPKLFLVDSIGAWVWVAAESRLTRLDAQSPTSQPVSITLPRDVQALASDEISGTLWVLSGTQLLAFDSLAKPKAKIDLLSAGIFHATTVAFDPVTRSVLVGHDFGLTRFSQAGANPHFVFTLEEIGVIGVAPFALSTQLSLTSPPAGALTANSLFPIELQLKELCNGVDCGFTGGVFQGYSISALLNGQQAGSSFVVDPITGKVTYHPVTRWLEGANTIKATATDPLGQASNEVSATFVVDTIPPSFVAVSPPDGFVSNNPAIHLTGSTDDPAARVVLVNASDVGGGGATQSTGSFDFALALKPGPNVVRLSATDLVGNSSNLALNYTLAGGIILTVDSPLDGSTVQSDLVSVRGTINPSSGVGVTVNGEPAQIVGSQWFIDNVPLVAGANAVQVIATTTDGTTTSKTISVTSSATAAFKLSAVPSQGIAPFIGQVTVVNNSDADIAQIDVDFNGDGIADVSTTNPNRVLDYLFTAPGIYRPTVTVTYTGGVKVVQQTTVVVLTGQQADDIFLALWQGFVNALAAGDKAKALSYLSIDARARMGPAFDALAGQMPAIVSSMSTPKRVSVIGGIAEYAVNRTIDGEDNIFFIYFMQDEAGLWTIDQL